MTALFIILLIALLICVFLLLRLKLVISCDTNIRVYIRFLFFKFNLYPKKPHKVKKKNKKKKSKPSAPAPKKENEESIKDNGALSKLWLMRKILLTTIEKFLGKLHFKFIRLNVIIGCENAAATALLYGAASQAVAYIIEVLDNISNVDISKRSDISVQSDFISQKSTVNGKIILKISLCHIIYVLLHFVKSIIKSKIKTEE